MSGFYRDIAVLRPDGPAADYPGAGDSVVDDPALDDPALDDPALDDPALDDTGADGSVTDSAVATDAGQRASPTSVPITVIEPEGHSRGGIVVLHESRDFADNLLELMRALAAEGWTVVAPNLFHRNGHTEAVFGDDLFADFDACLDWLTRHGVFGDCIGVLGFDSAGTAALLVATSRPIGAAISVAAPGIVAALDDRADPLVVAAPLLQAPWLGLYGTDDPATPNDHIDQLRDAAARAMVATLLVTYPGLRHRPDHSGFDSADSDDEETLVAAQARIFDWFDSHLR